MVELQRPMAQQEDDEVHVTPSRRLTPFGSGLGDGTTVHDVPSQCSMATRELDTEPTAQQSEAPGHVTLLSIGPLFGNSEIMFQETPSHRSRTVPPHPPESYPTAQHAEAEVQTMPYKEVVLHALVEATVHDVPSQRSISAYAPPTAQHCDGEEHATLKSESCVEMLGEGTIDQLSTDRAADAVVPLRAFATRDGRNKVRNLFGRLKADAKVTSAISNRKAIAAPRAM